MTLRFTHIYANANRSGILSPWQLNLLDYKTSINIYWNACWWVAAGGGVQAVNQTVNDSPQPQVPLTFGLWNTNCEDKASST